MTLWSVFCNATGLNRLQKSRLFNSEGYGGWDRNSTRTVDIVSGCFFLTDRALWEQLQGFDPTFFMYGEEADFCLRARQIGAQPMIAPTATIVHYGGVSEPDQADKHIKLLAGKVTLMTRHWPALPVPNGENALPSAPAHKNFCLWHFRRAFGQGRFPTRCADVASSLAKPSALDQRMEQCRRDQCS